MMGRKTVGGLNAMCQLYIKLRYLRHVKSVATLTAEDFPKVVNEVLKTMVKDKLFPDPVHSTFTPKSSWSDPIFAIISIVRGKMCQTQ